VIRALLFLLIAAAVMAGAVWLADRPGLAVFEWQGWRIETTVGIAATAMLALAALLSILYGLLHLLVRGPRRVMRSLRERRRRQGYQALSRGLVAVAAGDAALARRHAARAESLLEDPPLTRLLSAQAAQLAGNEAEATRHFNAMLQSPETAFLGLRGLLTQAMRAGDTPRALDLARRAAALRPNTPWVLTALLDLEIKSGEWLTAATTVDHARQSGALPTPEARRKQAAIHLEIARKALAEGRAGDAVLAAERAQRAEARHPAVPALLATAYARAGQARPAAKLVERSWPAPAMPAVLAAYRLAKQPPDPLGWVRQVEGLIAQKREAPESHLALGLAALDAGLWGQARTHLEAAAARTPDRVPASLARMMARLEDADRGDDTARRQWLDRAAEGEPDPAWLCEACGTAHAEWQAVCRRCGAFDRLAWGAPDRLRRVEAPPAAPALAAPAASS